MQSRLCVSKHSLQLFRVMLSGIFLVASLNHLIQVNKIVKRIEQANFKSIALFFGDLKVLVILSGITMFIAGFAFLIGFKTRIAASILALVLLPITLTIQVGQVTTLGPLFKNIAIMGGLLFFIINKINFKNQKS